MIQHVGVGLGVDLAAQDLFRAAYGEGRHLLTKLLLGRLHFLLDLRLRGGHEALAFSLGLGLRFLDALRRGFLGGDHDLLGAGAGVAQEDFGLLLRVGER